MIYIFFLIVSFKLQLSRDLWRGNMDLLFASFFLAITPQLSRNKKAVLAEGKDLEGKACHCAHSRRMGHVTLMCCNGRNDAWSPGLSSQFAWAPVLVSPRKALPLFFLSQRTRFYSYDKNSSKPHLWDLYWRPRCLIVMEFSEWLEGRMKSSGRWWFEA